MWQGKQKRQAFDSNGLLQTMSYLIWKLKSRLHTVHSPVGALFDYNVFCRIGFKNVIHDKYLSIGPFTVCTWERDREKNSTNTRQWSMSVYLVGAAQCATTPTNRHNNQGTTVVILTFMCRKQQQQQQSLTWDTGHWIPSWVLHGRYYRLGRTIDAQESFDNWLFFRRLDICQILHRASWSGR